MGRRVNFTLTISEVLARLVDRGLIEEPTHAHDGLAVCPNVQSWDRVALAASEHCECKVWPGAMGVTFQSSRSTFYLQRDGWEDEPGAMVQTLVTAKECAAELGVECPGWALGNIARRILDQLAPQEESADAWMRLRHGNNWGFFHAEPGYWERGSEFDVQSCYFQLWRRLPSLYPVPHRNMLGWGRMPPGAKERHALTCDILAPHKRIRNILVGCAMGSDSRKAKFARAGKWEWQNIGRAKFRCAGMLIVRSNWELCREAAIECNSCHSATDSVIATDGTTPHAWRRVGLATRQKSKGPTDVKGWGIYKCGDKVSKLYSDTTPYGRPTGVPAAPEVLFNKLWL